MSFSSNGTSSLYKSEVEGEAVGSSLTGCICNLPIKERMGCMALGLKWLYGRKMGNLQYLNNAWYDLYTFYCINYKEPHNVLLGVFWTSDKDRTLCSHCKGREAELYCKTVANGRHFFKCFNHVPNDFICIPEEPSDLLLATMNYRVVAVSELEMLFGRLWTQCQECQGSLHQDVLCTRYYYFLTCM
jgi:hypothetical protein